ncbi:MAG: RNA polymerase sigma factor [Gemmatimonadota bacterium]|nr:RNA polymerase sigma factor [Gemmatimonadota bacterium]
MHRPDLEAELERHHRAAYGWAMSCCGWDRTQADDVLQTSYLKVLEGRATFGGRSAFRTWLFGVIRRTALEYQRRNAIRRLLPLHVGPGSMEPPVSGTDPATAVEQKETTRRLTAALARLSGRQRELLHLVFYEDMSISQAADVLGIGVGTARTHYERGKRRLRELLGGRGEL